MCSSDLGTAQAPRRGGWTVASSASVNGREVASKARPRPQSREKSPPWPGRTKSVSWLFSFLSADQKKTYCLYEAANPDAIREQAKLLGIPADVIVEVSRIGPDMFAKSA